MLKGLGINLSFGTVIAGQISAVAGGERINADMPT